MTDDNTKIIPPTQVMNSAEANEYLSKSLGVIPIQIPTTQGVETFYVPNPAQVPEQNLPGLVHTLVKMAGGQVQEHGLVNHVLRQLSDADFDVGGPTCGDIWSGINRLDREWKEETEQILDLVYGPLEEDPKE